MLRRKSEVFAPTDGVLSVMDESEGRSARGIDFSTADGLSVRHTLAYRRMRLSARDVELSESSGVEVSAKVEVRKAPGLAPDTDVCAGGKVWDLTRVEGRGSTCWLWLAEIATDGTCTLLPPTIQRDSHGIPLPASDQGVTVWCRKVSPGARRHARDGTDALDASLSLRLRSCDYDGEGTLRRDGLTYTVTSVDHAGRWVDLSCSRKVGDR